MGFGGFIGFVVGRGGLVGLGRGMIPSVDPLATMSFLGWQTILVIHS